MNKETIGKACYIDWDNPTGDLEKGYFFSVLVMSQANGVFIDSPPMTQKTHIATLIYYPHSASISGKEYWKIGFEGCSKTPLNKITNSGRFKSEDAAFIALEAGLKSRGFCLSRGPEGVGDNPPADANPEEDQNILRWQKANVLVNMTANPGHGFYEITRYKQSEGWWLHSLTYDGEPIEGVENNIDLDILLDQAQAHHQKKVFIPKEY